MYDPFSSRRMAVAGPQKVGVNIEMGLPSAVAVTFRSIGQRRVAPTTFPNDETSLPNRGDLNTWSYAPNPSTLRIVAVGLASVAERNRCPYAVASSGGRAYGNGAHSCSNVLANCLAKILATKRLSELPIACL